MKTYYIGSNNYWYTASLILEDVPTGLYYLELITMWICSHIPSISLPPMKFKLKYQDDLDYIDNKDGWTTLKDWFGDTQQIFHTYICTPTTNFVWKHTKRVSINFPYEFLRERFPKEFAGLESEWDGEDQKFRTKTKRIADWVDALFRDVYRKLDFMYFEDSIK